MQLGQTQIDDTFAEAFRLRYVRLIVTAHDGHWLDAGLRAFTGYASSIIACDAEAGVEQYLSTETTPDGRPGASVLVFGFSAEGLAKSVANRTGQCLMTCATSAVYNGLTDAEEWIPLGKHIRFFGDGFQKSKLIDDRRYWRVPVMDGEFLVEEKLGVGKGIGGGNFIIQAANLPSALAAARRAIEAIEPLSNVVTPFPGGVARSGSKVGSRYKKLPASTAEAYCPTLRGRVESRLHPLANYALEIVLDGTDEESIRAAMAAGIHAAVAPDVVAISAGNYGGKLGKFHFHLRALLAAPGAENDVDDIP